MSYNWGFFVKGVRTVFVGGELFQIFLIAHKSMKKFVSAEIKISDIELFISEFSNGFGSHFLSVFGVLGIRVIP